MVWHVERMDEYRMARNVFIAEVSGGRVRVGPRLGWMDSINVSLDSRGMEMDNKRQCAKDRKEWRALVHMYMIKFNEAAFAWPCVLSDRPPDLWWIPSPLHVITTRAWEGGPKEHSAKQKWPRETHSVIYVTGLSTLSGLSRIVAQPPPSFLCCLRPHSPYPSSLTSVSLVPVPQ